MTGNEYNDSTQNICNKQTLYGEAISLLYQQFMVFEEKLNDLDKKIETKSDEKWVKKKITSAKEKIEKNYLQEDRILSKKITELNSQ